MKNVALFVIQILIKENLAMKDLNTVDFVCSPDCKELNVIVNNFKSTYYKNKAFNFAKKQVLTQILKWGAITAASAAGAAGEVAKQAVGRSAGVVVGLLYPSDLGTNTLVYGKTLDRINSLISEEGKIEQGKVIRELEHLKIAAQGIRIEQEWGDKKNCYAQLDKFTADLTRALFSAMQTQSGKLQPH